MAPKRRGKKKKHAAPRYVSNADELDNRNKAFGKESLARKARRRAAGCDDDDDDLANGAAKMSLSDYDDDEDQPVVRVKVPKSKGVQGLIETANPNAKKKKQNISAKDLAAGNFEKAQLSRREREIFEAEAAQRRHWKATAEGKTEQAKKDMKRLAEMRAKREAAKKKREEEAQAEAKRQEEQAARKAQSEASAGSDDLETPSKIQIKKMKPNAIKEHLKARGLSTQGNKKTIQARLLEACGY